jgi:hypothetical protein
MVMGLIAEACKDSMSKNMEEAMKMASSGIVDKNYRVRYAGLSCTALLLTELSPLAQKKFHSELMPMLTKIMNEESLIKMQTHSVSTMINFAKGLLDEDDGSKILMKYAKSLFSSLISLLKKAMNENYEPLQEEVINLIKISASILEKDFAQYYNEFMPMMLEILNNVGMTTIEQKTLRARTIDSMGFMIEAVSELKE